MSQHDFNIANQTFPSFRADLNDALQAAATISAGASAPTTPYPYQLWYDTANEKYKIRNAANSAWIDVFGLDASGNITIAADLSVDGGTIKLDGNYPVGTNNVALGDTALDDGSLSGNYNTAIGSGALTSNTSGTENTATGTSALLENTTGSYNTAVGRFAMRLNTTASYNTALGYQAGYSNTTGASNTAIGYQALDANTTANDSTAVGYNALTTSTGQRNTAVGQGAGESVTTGTTNTLVGRQAGYLITTGSNNTVIGAYSGNQDGLDIRTSSNNIVLSDGDGRPRIRIDSDSEIYRYYPSINQQRTDFNATSFGYSGSYTVLQLGQTSGQHTVSIGYDPSGNSSGSFSGDGSETLFRRGMKFLTPNSADTTFYTQFTMTDGVTSGDFNDTSDVALKENIQTISSAWDTVSQLRPVTFDWKQEGRGTRSGFIAQEVEVLLPNDVIGDDYAAPDAENGIKGNSGKAINTTGIVAHLTKALQEAMDRIETLEAKVATLEAN